MSTNQKYSTRLHSKRQLLRVSEHFKSAVGLILEVGTRYQEALPQVSLGCSEMVTMVSMLESMIDDIRENI